jgi:FixJ family two-component response regulator
MVEGHSSKEIAQRLRTSIKTVELHRFTPIIVPGSVAGELRWRMRSA